MLYTTIARFLNSDTWCALGSWQTLPPATWLPCNIPVGAADARRSRILSTSAGLGGVAVKLGTVLDKENDAKLTRSYQGVMYESLVGFGGWIESQSR